MIALEKNAFRLTSSLVQFIFPEEYCFASFARHFGISNRAGDFIFPSAAIRYRIPLLTTLSATAAATGAIRALQSKDLRVKSLQEHHLRKEAR